MNRRVFLASGIAVLTGCTSQETTFIQAPETQPKTYAIREVTAPNPETAAVFRQAFLTEFAGEFKVSQEDPDVGISIVATEGIAAGDFYARPYVESVLITAADSNGQPILSEQFNQRGKYRTPAEIATACAQRVRKALAKN